MEYINDININEAIIHILDSNSEEPVFNEYTLQLNDEVYGYLVKHIQKALKDEELRYAVFNKERNIVKEMCFEYLSGQNDILTVSKELATQMFKLMKSNSNIPSSDLIIASISTEYGPMIGILKMDYIKNYTHNIEFIGDKIGINIISQITGLPSGTQRLQKCAFVKPYEDDTSFNLMIIDKQPKKNGDKDEYGTNYFLNSYLGCTIINNERDMTKNLLNASEVWTRNNLTENASKAEKIRTAIKKSLKEEENINIDKLSENLFHNEDELKDNFTQYVKNQGVNDDVVVDKTWVEKKLKRIRLNIDKSIDLYLDEEIYNDNSKFEIQRNGDGSINIVIKHVYNYIEK